MNEVQFCVIYLKGIEEEEQPCKDSGVGVDGQQPNHPGEAEEGEDDHKGLQECAVCGRGELHTELAAGAHVSTTASHRKHRRSDKAHKGIGLKSKLKDYSLRDTNMTVTENCQ